MAINGAKEAPKIPAKLKVNDAPEYRTSVGNNSDKKVPTGPYVNPINPIPTQTKVVIIGVLPDSIKKEKVNPKSAIKQEIKTKILFRPN